MAEDLDLGEHLNEQQVLMLRLLRSPHPEKDFLQMRKLAVKLLSKQLDVVIEDWEDKQNIKSDQYEKLGNGHFRSK